MHSVKLKILLLIRLPKPLLLQEVKVTTTMMMMTKKCTLKLQTLFGNISRESILLRKLNLSNKNPLFSSKLTKTPKKTQLTVKMMTTLITLNVLLNKSIVTMLNLLTMLNA